MMSSFVALSMYMLVFDDLVFMQKSGLSVSVPYNILLSISWKFGICLSSYPYSSSFDEPLFIDLSNNIL